MTWSTGNTVSREEAQGRISDMEKDQGINGAFKVYYESRSNQIVTPSDLPENVDLSKVIISASLDQAVQ